jgi:dimethylhistidine N-methyltransferase
MTHPKTGLSTFATDVYNGLNDKEKSVPSKYFYDEEGDRIFQQIMNMPEYYLTNAEFEILSEQSEVICKAMGVESGPFNLIEFGAGDGYKTKVLLNKLIELGAKFTYYPVDISMNILEELSVNLKKEIPLLKIEPLNMDYFSALRYMHKLNDLSTVTLFLGSNIGNFHLDEAADFLRELSANCISGDMLLLGVDLKKDTKVITDAYNDPHGITAAFNLNLLRRMNRELGADFNLENFRHLTYYEEETGEVVSYLVSLVQQSVYFKELDWKVHFHQDERIHTEISRKYSLEELEAVANKDNYDVVSHFLDSRKYFTDTLWKVR